MLYFCIFVKIILKKIPLKLLKEALNFKVLNTVKRNLKVIIFIFNFFCRSNKEWINKFYKLFNFKKTFSHSWKKKSNFNSTCFFFYIKLLKQASNLTVNNMLIIISISGSVLNLYIRRTLYVFNTFANSFFFIGLWILLLFFFFCILE